MKYIGAITMILVGALLIGLAATIPGFSIVNITSTTATVTYGQSSSYPTSTSASSPTIFASSTNVTLTVAFSTGYDFAGVSSSSASGSVTIVDYNTSSTIGTYSTSWSTASQIYSSAEPYYKIVATSSYKFNNPITGGTHVYEIKWSSTLTYNAKVEGASSYTTGTVSATGIAVYGKFSPATVYPGYFVLQNCTSSWSASGSPYTVSLSSGPINILIPYTQSDAYLEFIYVEYNASGNTQAGFSEAYILVSTTGSAPWILTNTTTYDNYPALYMHVELPPGSYTIDGYALYNYGQNGGLEQLFEMSSTWNISQLGQITLNSNQLITYAVGAILIFVGAIDAWKWHI